MTDPAPDIEAEAEAGAPPRPAPRRRPARRSSLPPTAWLVAPVVVGLLAGLGLVWDHHVRAAAPWCGRIQPVLDALSDLEAGAGGPEAVADLAAATRALDVPALADELPDELGRRVRDKADQWARLAQEAALAAPGSTFLQVVPFGLVPDVAALKARYERECTRL